MFLKFFSLNFFSSKFSVFFFLKIFSWKNFLKSENDKKLTKKGKKRTVGKSTVRSSSVRLTVNLRHPSVGLDCICIWWLSVCHDGPIPRDNIWCLWARWNTTLVPPNYNWHLWLIPALLNCSLSLPHTFLNPPKPIYISILLYNTTQNIFYRSLMKAYKL